ncbi:MAG TPA: ABC transporter permease, partial [Henriciella marina]|nr:ABC transporter permease [Henriciella marina]
MSEATSQISDDRRETLPDQGGADRPKARSVKPLALLWPYVRKHLTLVFVALFFLVVSTVAALSIPWLFGRAVDAGAGGANGAALLDTIDQYFLYVLLAAVLMG